MKGAVPAVGPLTGEAARLFPAEHHLLLARCGSTNDEARRLLAAGAPEGTLVLADAQDAGRGRRGRAWHSPPGRNVHLSLVLRPALPPEQTPLLTLALAVAALDAVRAFGVPAAIKWPNDLVIRDAPSLPARKLGGLICEAVVHGGRVGVVAGIGIDVNVRRDELPAELREIATSMRERLGRRLERAAVVAAVLERFAPRYASLQAAGAAPLLAAYERRLDTLGRDVTVDLGDRVITGRALRLGPGGALVVQGAGGSRTTISAGDVGL